MNVFDFSNVACKSIFPKSNNDIIGVLHKRRDVKVITTASSTYVDSDSAYRYPHGVVEYDKVTWWTSAPEPNQWIMFNFTKRLLISNYSVQTTSNDIGDNHPKQWKAEGYNEVDSWVEIDVVTESKLNGPYLIETRPTNNNGKPFDSVRLTRTGENWGINECFRIYKIDFFGLVETKTCFLKTCKMKKHNIQLIIIITNLLSS